MNGKVKSYGRGQAVKLFQTIDMPRGVVNTIGEADTRLIDDYVVGSTVRDVESDPDEIGIDVDEWKAVDSWLIENGADNYERVLIYHGMFRRGE